jgi:HEAT repeat protein
MELTKDASRRVRNTAVAGLGAFAAGPRVADFLRQVARGGDPDFRMRAVFASGPPNLPAVQALWLELLNDPAEQIVVNAASKLGDSRRADVVEPLIAALHRVGENHPAFAFILRATNALLNPSPPI